MNNIVPQTTLPAAFADSPAVYKALGTAAMAIVQDDMPFTPTAAVKLRPHRLS